MLRAPRRESAETYRQSQDKEIIIKYSFQERQKSDTGLHENLTHFIDNVSTSFWIGLENGGMWRDIIIKERSILIQIALHLQ